MTTAALTGTIFPMMQEDESPASKIYMSPVGPVISYTYFKSCIDKLNESAKEDRIQSEECISSLAGQTGDATAQSGRLVRKLKELAKESKLATIAIFIMFIVIVTLSILLIAL